MIRGKHPQPWSCSAEALRGETAAIDRNSGRSRVAEPWSHIA